MSIINRIKPEFWDYSDVASGSHEHLFDFRRMWKLAAILTATVSIIPLVFLSTLNYHVTQSSIEAEKLSRTARLVSNTQRTIFYFFAERRSALEFIVKENSFEVLNTPGVLEQILKNLKNSFGGFTDLGLIDPLGRQRGYVGPFKLAGKDYSDQNWYREVMKNGVYISDVFLGFRNVPHIVIAVKRSCTNGLCYVLRADLDIKKLDDLLSNIEMAGRGDAFMINRQGVLQTPSLYHGKVLEKVSLPVPKYALKTQVIEANDPAGVPLFIGYRYISDTPFILMVVKHKEICMMSWYKTRMKLIAFLGISITIILIVVAGMATYLVNKAYVADQKRIMTLHQVEYTNKMASVGRLAAGVAHEVNNPLAVINEKAGLIKDLVTLKQEFGENPRLLGLVDSILSCVKRAGNITKRLLSFSRNMEVSFEPVNLKELIEEVLSFLTKEAEYRSIRVSLTASDDVPQIESDRGKLQEIFLNLINNAFAAMSDGGNLGIQVRQKETDNVSVTVADDGCGISQADMNRIFEPFFSTKTKKGGTGLGLSLTQNFVREIGGSLNVESVVGKGTTFTITLPFKMQTKEGGDK
ncbi:MAG: ATP-binding protein [Deltaproteobacteria bacterium]|nr:ATP-binding protein [Deltaproteobacteria bacterium]MBW2344086.1 ATP-binding protein [Deltaproteobacteria bacterium]